MLHRSEVRSNLDEPLSQKRMDLVYLASTDSVPTVGDVTIRHPCPPSAVARLPSDRLDLAEVEKQKKYGELCDADGYRLEVLGFEQYGRMSDSIKNLISRLSGLCKDGLGISRYTPYDWATRTFASYWRRRLSVNLQRSLGIAELELARDSYLQSGGNSISIRGRWYAFSLYDREGRWVTLPRLSDSEGVPGG